MSLEDAIAVANHRIRNEGDADPNLRGMGTTVVALALMPDEPDPDVPDAEDTPPEHLVIANVGDSRAYLFRDGSLVQLTEDHSVVADLVRDGRITAEEAEVHPQRNIVTRVLGVYETIDVDLWPVDPVAGDRVLLCSDGLFNEVGTDQITQRAAPARRPIGGGGRAGAPRQRGRRPRQHHRRPRRRGRRRRRGPVRVGSTRRRDLRARVSARGTGRATTTWPASPPRCRPSPPRG